MKIANIIYSIIELWRFVKNRDRLRCWFNRRELGILSRWLLSHIKRGYQNFVLFWQRGIVEKHTKQVLDQIAKHKTIKEHFFKWHLWETMGGNRLHFKAFISPKNTALLPVGQLNEAKLEWLMAENGHMCRKANRMEVVWCLGREYRYSCVEPK